MLKCISQVYSVQNRKHMKNVNLFVLYYNIRFNTI